ncbi:hypothetical protein F5Y10DRAFT_241118 [Nemania abortiva]|nr:hypothetical protein F5Y10DRAFT_241118 [Nemania abortiva]
MSPKVDSKASVAARSAWSRDVRPNASGVTYVRRSYYYDREFSDSIIPPTNDFEQFPPEGWTVTRRSGVRRMQSRGRSAAELRVVESDKHVVDPFTRGRVLQSAGNDDEYESVFELESYNPVKSAQTPSSHASAAAAAASAPADSEHGTTIAGLDVQAIAQGIVVAADILVRITEAYQRLRDSEGNGEGGDDEFLGLDLDPYHLEAGPPRRKLPARKTTPGRSLIGSTASVTSMDEAQGHASSQNNNATTAQEGQLLPPLPAIRKICYYLIATVIFGVVASLGIALWWAQVQGDVSDGFTIGGYIIAVDALAVAVVSLVHRPRCRCWAG